MNALLAALVGLTLLSSSQPPRISALDVPAFRLRARVTRIGSNAPPEVNFKYRWDSGETEVSSAASEWSSWLEYTASDAEKGLQAYPMAPRQRFPMIVKLYVSPVKDPTDVDAELKFEGGSTAFHLHAQLFGPVLGIMIWRDEARRPLAATVADYNRRYWGDFDANAVARRQRASHFILADEFRGADDDRIDWTEGLRHLSESGITALRLDPIAALRPIALGAGIHHFVTAAGGAIIGDELGYKPVNETPDEWAQRLARNFSQAGFLRSEIATFGLADEPAWSYPDAYHSLEQEPARLRDFRSYLAAQHLTPPELGKRDWNDVGPLGQSAAGLGAGLEARRLFYWTARYFPWHSANYFARVTRDLQNAFHSGLEVYTNWNNFSGTLYFDVPVRSGYPNSPDEAGGAHDWFEFGRLHGVSMLWTEDWFANQRAYQWSFYCSRLASIAAENGLRFGAYVVPRPDGEPLYGLLQKVLAIVGAGGKAIEYYTFGPEYSFPGNCYSEVSGVEKPIAQANRIIAAAEDVLWPGQRARSQVAILQPRSAEIWDRRHLPDDRIAGATNNELNDRTVDYMAEVFDTYLALQMANVPVDFLDEDDLNPRHLAPYKVLYISEPDIPSEGQVAIRDWVKSGGTLVMVPGAAQADRYDEPVTILTSLDNAQPHRRAFMGSQRVSVTALEALKPDGTLHGEQVFGGRALLKSVAGARAFFDDHTVAVSDRPIGAGRIVSFAWFPGISFARAALGHALELKPAATHSIAQQWILYPVRTAQVEPPVRVDTPMIETPLLLSRAGAAVTMLNWGGSGVTSVTATVRVPFRVRSASSSMQGSIRFEQDGTNVKFSIPLGPADIVALRS